VLVTSVEEETDVHGAISRSARAAAILPVVLAVGCAATYATGRVAGNPLPEVARKAADKGDSYAVTWIDDNTLRLRDTWPTHSIFSLGWTAFIAELYYADQTLDGRFYLRSNQIGLLFIPTYLDAEPGFVGGALKPYMRKQMKEILDWAGVDTPSRRSGSVDEPFPPGP
jgi:hypothetical protein